MKRARTIAELKAWRDALPRESSLGLVPTMGALHDGHLSLVRRAVADNDAAVATAFVNPGQFDDPRDLAAYPRNLEGDAALLAAAGCDLLFSPPAGEIYPPGYQTWIEVGEIAERLEGASRPGHFRGVATVVAKLFHLTRPHRAYFGEKDAQQLAVIERMVRDLELAVQVVRCATVREADGLAMSSRNRRLSRGSRAAARRLYQALLAAHAGWERGELDAGELRRAMRRRLDGEPPVEIDYLSVADPRHLTELTRVDPATGALVSLAARVGGVRLIDNLTLPPRAAAPTDEVREPC